MSDQQELRCPICLVGVVADIAFDRDPSRPQAVPQQTPETTELTTYSCGHQVPGRSLASADAEALDVERRQSQDTVAPPPGA
ncbi:MAG: hypothetical protein ABJB55_01670 [Actinomycetota bacterium]